MPYDESIAARVRKALNRARGVVEKKMFGGLAFLVNGHMCCGVLNTTLVLKLGNERAAAAIKEPHTRAMDFTGRPLKSMVYVEPDGFATDAQLKRWLQLALAHAASLPPK